MGKFEEASRKLAKAINAHDLDAVTKAYASDAVAYDPMYPEPLRGREAIKKDAADSLRAFPDMRFEISSVIEKDDGLGAGEVRITGTHTGPLATPTGGGGPPPNKRIEHKGAAVVPLKKNSETVEGGRYYAVVASRR